jgi:hypothetical protein
MVIKQSVLAAAAAVSLGLGAAGQASAAVYGASALSIDDLAIFFLDSSNNSAAGNVTINNFTFTLQNTAVLNGVSGANGFQTATCGGTIASNTCGAAPALTLNAAAANAQGSSFNRGENQISGDGTFTVFGIGLGTDWSNSDSVIRTSELTSAGANPTVTDQIAESKISSVLSASASSLIQSITGFTLSFTVTGPNPTDLSVSFLADPDMRAEILNEIGVAAAQANMAVSLKLQKDGAIPSINWAPDGTTTTNNCLTTGGITCSETLDSENLNLTVGTTTNNTAASHSWGPNVEGSVGYGISANSLSAGNWTLTLKAETSTQLSRTDVPEPGSMALVGLAMLALGAAGRRRKV